MRPGAPGAGSKGAAKKVREVRGGRGRRCPGPGPGLLRPGAARGRLRAAGSRLMPRPTRASSCDAGVPSVAATTSGGGSPEERRRSCRAGRRRCGSPGPGPAGRRAKRAGRAAPAASGGVEISVTLASSRPRSRRRAGVGAVGHVGERLQRLGQLQRGRVPVVGRLPHHPRDHAASPSGTSGTSFVIGSGSFAWWLNSFSGRLALGKGTWPVSM